MNCVARIYACSQSSIHSAIPLLWKKKRTMNPMDATAVAVDEENSLLFVAGSTKGEYAVGGPGGDSWETGERALFSDFLVIAMNANGGTIWAYQDAGRLPSEVRTRLRLRGKGLTWNIYIYIYIYVYFHQK